MEKITKRNSIIRLKYKMQIAYSFIMEEFGGDIKRFKSEFDASKIEKLREWKAKGSTYLKYRAKKFDSLIFQQSLEQIQDQHKNEWLSNDERNTLFKFYILTYILLPVELRGDFLGFVKKHYYDIKNVEFLNENDVGLTREKLEEMKDNSFFDKIRLFEKNSKKYNIFDISLLDSERLKKYLKLLNLDIPYTEYTDADGKIKGIFNKNITMPIFKYYQIVLKLYNDIELAILLILSNVQDEESLENIKDKAKIKGHYNFNTLLKNFNQIISKENGELSRLEKTLEDGKVVQLRNKICHLNYEEFIDKLLLVNTEIEYEKNDEEVMLINRKILNLVKYVTDTQMESRINLGFNYINDYYMRKEQFMLGQLKQTKEMKVNSKQAKKIKKENTLLVMYNLDIDSDIRKIYEVANKLRETLDSELFLLKIKSLKGVNLEKIIIKGKSVAEHLSKEDINSDFLKKELYKQSSDLLGIYKKKVIKDIKREIINKLKYEEEKILNIWLYNVNKDVNHENKKEHGRLFIIRKKVSDEFYILTMEQIGKYIENGNKKKLSESFDVITDNKKYIYKKINNSRSQEKQQISMKLSDENRLKMEIYFPELYDSAEEKIITKNLGEYYCFNIDINYQE